MTMRYLNLDQNLLKKTVYIDFGDSQTGFTIKVMLFTGYYEAAILDYRIFDYKGHEVDGEDELIDNCILDIEDQTELSNGWIAMQKKNLKNKVSKILQSELEKLEAELDDYSTPYTKAYQFSNGETGYRELIPIKAKLVAEKVTIPDGGDTVYNLFYHPDYRRFYAQDLNSHELVKFYVTDHNKIKTIGIYPTFKQGYINRIP